MAQGKDPVTRPNGGGSDRSHEIEADIDRTRAAMDRTVDAIAGKLTPQQLMVEAMGVFRDGSSALATKVVQTAKEHPLPAAIIGIGLGLLFTEKSRSEKEAEAMRNRNVGYSGFGGYGAYPGGEPSAVRTDFSGSGYGREGYGAAGYGTAGYGSAGAAGYGSAGFRTEGYASTGGGTETSGSGGGRMEGFTSSVKDKTADIKDSVALGAMEARDRVGQTAAQVKDQASHVKEQVADKAGHIKEQVATTVSASAEQMRESADRLREQVAMGAGRVREQAAQVPVYARQHWREAQLGFWQTMDQKPFAIGMAALAAGVAAGLTVPSSRKEKELMGETRDRLLDQAREMGREAVDKGRQVARAASDVVKTEVERSGLKPGDIAEKVRSISREAEQALKSEAGKVMPDMTKATGSSMPMTGSGSNVGGAAGRGMSAGFASTDADSTIPGSGSTGMGTTGTSGTTGSTGTTGTTGTAGTTGTTGTKKNNTR